MTNLRQLFRGLPRRAVVPQMVFAACALAGLRTGPLLAQARDEPLYQQLVRTFQRDYLRLGALLQTVGDFQFERSFVGNNGFSVANFRVSLSGELDERFGYFLQTNFATSPSILDASMYYRISPQVRVDVGQMKAPFSREFLTSAASIDFVNRAQAVTALAPGRQIGLKVGVANGARNLGVDFGAFNGNNTQANANDNDSFLFSARVYGRHALAPQQGLPSEVALGLNLAHTRDTQASFGSGFVTGFAGDRTLVGADVRATLGNYLLSGELIVANLDPVLGGDRTPWGLHATGGVMLGPEVQGLLRFDLFEPDDGVGRRDWVVFGVNVWPTAVTEFQVNYVVDVNGADVDNHQLLVNFQFGF